MPALLLLAFLAVPILELYVILQVADVIGGWQTLAVLIAESFLGTWLVRREGRRTWQAFQAALQQHRPPAREVADGALVIVGGTLLLTPGFLSDIVGFFFLLPLTRPLARRLLLRVAARRMGMRLSMFGAGSARQARQPRGETFGSPAGGPEKQRRGSGPGRRGPVIDGEVLHDDPRGRPDQPSNPNQPPNLSKGPNDGTPPSP